MLYELWILAISSLVAATCGIVGTFLVLRRIAMVADAISHTVLLGIVGAFLVSQTLEGPLMLIGAAVVGLATTYFIQVLDNAGVPADAAIGVVFTSLFSVGVILVSLYARDVHLDVDHVLMGDISFAPFHTIEWNGIPMGPQAFWVILAVFIIDLALILLLYKEFKITSFDPALAAALGIPVTLIHYLLMTMVSITAVASFDAVGAILVVALLIVPPATAYLLTEKLSRMIIVSALTGVAAAVTGYYTAKYFNVSIAGCIASAAGALFLIAFLFSPSQGILLRGRQRKKAAAPASS